jgi:hypothetical protein
MNNVQHGKSVKVDSYGNLLGHVKPVRCEIDLKKAKRPRCASALGTDRRFRYRGDY